ncbi:MAG: nuclear transport factor 2 family protein [Novosphingobium sp.]|nr:nuclear transport factor 2 family protein [Novosphingobium sp.]
MLRRFTTFTAVLALGASSCLQAQDLPPAQLDALARDVSRVEAVRAVKDLERSYAQYAQYGLWQEMAPLFADHARIVWGDTTIAGPKAIAAWLKGRVGGREGLSAGALHTEIIDSELVNLSVDGKSARMRLEAMSFSGDGKGGTAIDGGTYENEYVLEDGHWKFATMRYFPQLAGDYARGWANAGGSDLTRPAYHFTVDETGVPIPAPQGPAPASGTTLAAVEERVDRLNQEDAVRNLQNAYGYYVDRRMWDDVVDLFADDCAVEIAGVGTFRGKAGVRQAMERMGPQGLTHGQLNDHPLFSVMVEVLPGHREALSRGIQLGMTGEADKGTAAWEFATFRNRFVKDQGLWKIKELRLYPQLQADYANGWGGGGTARPAEGMLPAFIDPNPVTGQEIALAGTRPVGTDRLTAPPPGAGPDARPGTEMARLLDATRRLKRSAAYDGVENVSHAYGYYLTDAFWDELGSIFAKGGNKHSPFAGFYLGQDRIRAAATAMYGKPGPTRPSIPYHWRPQPVILVSHDGRSATLRTRLFQPGTAKPKADGGPLGGSLSAGMYANDQAVLENGIWRLWSLTIDEPYWSTAGWRAGWSGAKDVAPGKAAGKSPLVDRLPPDIPMEALGRRAEHFRGGTGVTYQWPQILPMWFAYKNLVSGRVPENYWPDSTPSLVLPQSRLIANGYEMPPTGPSDDGLPIELTPPGSDKMEGN